MSEPPQSPSGSAWHRRDVLLGGLAAACVLARPARAAQDAVAEPACTLTPELTEGPFYLDRQKLRRDISEGKPGLPLVLRIRLLDANTCRPLPAAAVDLWHCDAAGVYSGFSGLAGFGSQVAGRGPGPGPGFAPGPGGPPPPGDPGMPPGPDRFAGHPPPRPRPSDHQTFLRGLQFTGADGVAEFRSIVPGWYAGRAVHVHLKAHVGGKRQGGHYAGGHVCHTGQFGFAEDFYNTISPLQPYAQHHVPRTPLQQDGILGRGAGPALLTLTPLGAAPQQGYLGTIAFAVDPAAVPSAR